MAPDLPEPPKLRILLISDPGLPSRRVSKIQDRFRSYLVRTYPHTVDLLTVTDTIRLRPDNTLDVASAAALAAHYDDVDAVLLLTEIPRYREDHPLVAEIFPEHNVGVISCPTVGAVTTRRRILKVLLDCVARLIPPSGADSPGELGADPQPRVRWTEWFALDSGHVGLRSGRWVGSVRTVMGMTMANDPWRTAPRLSSALAAATATGAFGIFYSSIWQMAEYLSTVRLVSIGVLAVAVMVTWLIVSNGLWDRPVKDSLSRVMALYNLSTILTLLVCVVALYLLLVVLILLGGLIVISPEFMATLLDTDRVQFTNYLDIAWLSAAMGVVAGGLGSSFDSRTDLKKLTHGQRERQRRYAED